MQWPQTIDRFVILRELGVGGMGTVYEAVDRKIDRHVALKLLHPHLLAQNPELLTRLWIEAKAANSIRHPGVVQISEAGQTVEGTGYLVMELLEGQLLSQRLAQHGQSLPLSEALRIAIQLASTLSAAHQKGIVHRDLKPQNVMLVPDDAAQGGERVKILDFGIAKLMASALNSTGLTIAGSGLGTPGYMAPEQIEDASAADDRCDVYGLGSLLFHLLAGRAPHVAGSPHALILAVVRDDVPPIEGLVLGLPEALCQLLAQMFRRSPLERPPMGEVLLRLQQCQRELAHGDSPKLFPALVPKETPPTIVGLPPSGKHLPLSDELLPVNPDPARPPRLPPSAGTISGASWQRSPEHHAEPSRRAWIVAIALPLVIFAGIGVGLFVSAKDPHVTNPVPVSQNVSVAPASSPVPLAPVESLPLVKASALPMEPASTNLSELSPAPRLAPMAPHIKVPAKKSSGCVPAPLVIETGSDEVRRATSDAISAYHFHLCRGERLRIRENPGDHSLFVDAGDKLSLSSGSGPENRNWKNFLLRIGGSLRTGPFVGLTIRAK